MTTMSASIDKHHKSIIIALSLIILAMVTSCTFHDVIPICHWLFGCDHQLHSLASL